MYTLLLLSPVLLFPLLVLTFNRAEHYVHLISEETNKVHAKIRVHDEKQP